MSHSAIKNLALAVALTCAGTASMALGLSLNVVLPPAELSSDPQIAPPTQQSLITGGVFVGIRSR